MHPAHSATDDISSPSPRSATDGGVTVKISLLTGTVICMLSLFFLCKILAPCTMSSISCCKLNMPSHKSASEQNCSHLSFCKCVHGKILKRKFRLLCASAVFPSPSPTPAPSLLPKLQSSYPINGASSHRPLLRSGEKVTNIRTLASGPSLHHLPISWIHLCILQSILFAYDA